MATKACSIIHSLIDYLTYCMLAAVLTAGGQDSIRDEAEVDLLSVSLAGQLANYGAGW